LNSFIRKQIAIHPERQFFLITGGGKTARQYIEAGRDVIGRDPTDDDLDWLGIHSTRLNGQLVRTIFRDIAHPVIMKDFDHSIRKATEPVVVAAGWKPGRSTDFVAVQIAEDYGAQKIINLSNIQQVYDKDPAQYDDAVPLDEMSWAAFRAMVGDSWSPGLNAPFDPVASKKASELGLTVAVMDGKDLDNLENYLEGKLFVGTVIE
jgi:uridylate kinase